MPSAHHVQPFSSDDPDPVANAYTSPDLPAILRDAETVAIVGCSDDLTRYSNRAARYMRDAGYTVVPVNPFHDELLGVKCYPSVTSVGEDIELDVVVIFRKPAYTADMVRDIITRFEQTGQRPVIWTQIGVSSSEARDLALDGGFTYVSNRCVMVEHARLGLAATRSSDD